nr:uncharacterized protein LOC110568026 [Aotus nancymaae]
MAQRDLGASDQMQPATRGERTPLHTWNWNWKRQPPRSTKLVSSTGKEPETTWAGKGAALAGFGGAGRVKAPAPIGRRRSSNAIRQNGPRVGGNKEAKARAGYASAPSADWLSELERLGARADGSHASGAPGM